MKLLVSWRLPGLVEGTRGKEGELSSTSSLLVSLSLRSNDLLLLLSPVGQTLAWNRHHQLLCKQLPSLTYKLKGHQLDEPTRLDALLLARLAAEHFSAPDRIPSNIIKTISNFPPESFLPHELFLSLLPTHSLTSSSPIPSLLAPHLPPHLTSSELDLLLARFPRNNHSLTSQDSNLEPFANVVLAGISRAANHSCSPSAVISCSWQGDGVLNVGLRTIRSLREEDEVRRFCASLCLVLRASAGERC